MEVLKLKGLEEDFKEDFKGLEDSRGRVYNWLVLFPWRATQGWSHNVEKLRTGASCGRWSQLFPPREPLCGDADRNREQMSLSSVLPVPLCHLSPETGKEPGKGETWFAKA